MAEITQLRSADEKSLGEVSALLTQLNGKGTTLESLKAVLESPEAELWVAEEAGKIVGMATLVLVVKVSGTSARLEDVVVDEGQRGKGLGRLLCEKLIERAKERGAHSVNLTSRPEREAANALYQKLGFEKRETNAYRLKLK